MPGIYVWDPLENSKLTMSTSKEPTHLCLAGLSLAGQHFFPMPYQKGAPVPFSLQRADTPWVVLRFGD